MDRRRWRQERRRGHIPLRIARHAPFRHEVNGNTARELTPETFNPYAAPRDAGLPAPERQCAPLAKPSTRLVAQLLDGVMYLLAALPGAGLGAFLGSSVEFPKDDGGVQSGAAIFAMGLAGVTCSVLYIYQCFLIANSGQSLGKRWSHVRIVLEDGQPPGFGKGIVLRSWVLILLRLIPFVGSVVSLVDTLMIFSDGHRCLHDRIAGTRVVVAD